MEALGSFNTTRGGISSLPWLLPKGRHGAFRLDLQQILHLSCFFFFLHTLSLSFAPFA